MEELHLADKYAKALISLAEEAGLIDRLEKELTAFQQLVKQNPQLCEIFLSPIIAYPKKEELLQSICQEKHVSPELSSFLSFLLRMRRFNLFGQICQVYQDLIYSLRKRLKVIIESAFALDADQKQALKTRLARIYQRNIDLFLCLNPQLIGGARIFVGHTVFDLSVQAQLALMRENLWKE